MQLPSILVASVDADPTIAGSAHVTVDRELWQHAHLHARLAALRAAVRPPSHENEAIFTLTEFAQWMCDG